MRRFHLVVPDVLWARLERVAKVTEKTYTSIIRDAIEEEVDDLEIKWAAELAAHDSCNGDGP